MKKILICFGTRPEAVKMCPLVRVLLNRAGVEARLCVTGQHRELLRQVLEVFGLKPDYDLDIMRPEQSLFDLTGEILSRLRGILEAERPDLVLVHGDTTTAFAASLACFYLHIPVGHVEAGLRTYDLAAPFPEEFNRQAVDLTAAWLFAPTEAARANLLREGRDPERVFVTGNTGIDALRTTVRPDFTHPELEWAAGSRLVVLTAHRRENWGEPMERMFRAIRGVLEEHEDVKIVYPIHPNPRVRAAAEAAFAGCGRVHLIEPLPTIDFHNLLARSYLILTDSGGIQEEAPSLGKPVLVLRDVTERPEGVEAGTLKVTGTGEEAVRREFRRLLEDPAEYARMSRARNPYGDGRASERIADILCGEE